MQASPLTPCGPYRLTKGQANLAQLAATVDGPAGGRAREGSRPLSQAQEQLIMENPHDLFH
jgi:hypothetical protein